MQKFKRIMLPMQGKNKRELHWLYNTSNDLELPKEFYSGKLKFYFGGTGFRSSERMILFIEIPENIILKKDLESTETVGEVSFEKHPSVETYLLHLIAPLIQSLSEEYRNEDKDTREKAGFEVQQAGSYMVTTAQIGFNTFRPLQLISLFSSRSLLGCFCFLAFPSLFVQALESSPRPISINNLHVLPHFQR